MSETTLAPTPAYARRSDEGYYTWDGVKYPSVTTILDVAPGKHLMPWYAKMAAKESADLVVLYEAGELPLNAALTDVKAWEYRMRAPERYRDRRGNIGSLVHHALYHKALGSLFAPTPEAFLEWLAAEAGSLQLLGPETDGAELRRLAAEAYPKAVRAVDWVDKEKPDFESIGLEACVVSEEHGYAGTLDAIARLGGKRLVLDFKTSSRISDSFRFQVEAYRRADFIGLIGDGSRHELGETDGTAIVHIKEEGVDLVEFPPSEDVWEGWLGLVRYFRALKGLPPIPRKPAAPKVVAPAKTTPREVPF